MPRIALWRPIPRSQYGDVARDDGLEGLAAEIPVVHKPGDTDAEHGAHQAAPKLNRTASNTNWESMSRFFAPMAFLMPDLRMRSVTDTA